MTRFSGPALRAGSPSWFCGLAADEETAPDGVLYERRVCAQGLNAVKALNDFNAMSFAPIAAPYWPET